MDDEHDPLCRDRPRQRGGCQCELIAQVQQRAFDAVASEYARVKDLQRADPFPATGFPGARSGYFRALRFVMDDLDARTIRASR